MARQRSRTQESPERTSRLAKHSSGKRLPPPTPTQVVERSGAVRSLMANHRLKKSIKIPSHGEQGICSVRLLSVSLVSCSRVCVGRRNSEWRRTGGPGRGLPHSTQVCCPAGGHARRHEPAERASRARWVDQSFPRNGAGHIGQAKACHLYHPPPVSRQPRIQFAVLSLVVSLPSGN